MSTTSTSVIATKAAKAAAKVEANGVAEHSVEDIASLIGSSAPPLPKPSSVKKPTKEKEEGGDKTDNEEEDETPKKTEKKNGSKKGSKRKENPSTSRSTSTSAADAETKSTKTKKTSKSDKKEEGEEEGKKKGKTRAPKPVLLRNYRESGNSLTADSINEAVSILLARFTGSVLTPISGVAGVSVPTSVVDGCNAYTENAVGGIYVRLTDAFTSVNSKIFNSLTDLENYEEMLTKPSNKMLLAAFGALLARDTQGVYYLDVEGFWAFHKHSKLSTKDANEKSANETYLKTMYSVAMPNGTSLVGETTRLEKVFKDRLEAKDAEIKKKGTEDAKKKKATISARKQKALDNKLEWCDACDDLKMLCTCGSEQPAPKKQKKDTTATTSAKPSDGKAEAAAATTTPSTATTSTSVAADTPTSKDGDKSDADDDEDNADDK